ncbi:MAG: hypothetical protein QW719_02880 [Candidatus Micrarchaeaceae archaeon]
MKTNKASTIVADTSTLINTFRDLTKTIDETQQSMLLAIIGFEHDGALQILEALTLDDSQKEKKEQLLRAGIKNMQMAQKIKALREAFIKSLDYTEPKSYDEYKD